MNFLTAPRVLDSSSTSPLTAIYCRWLRVGPVRDRGLGAAIDQPWLGPSVLRCVSRFRGNSCGGRVLANGQLTGEVLSSAELARQVQF
jgi:hypothetical protein